MTILWISLVILALLVTAIAFVRPGAWRRRRYVDSPEWTVEHWREQHDRAKVQQQRMTGN